MRKRETGPRLLTLRSIREGWGHGWLESLDRTEENAVEKYLSECVYLHGNILTWDAELRFCDITVWEDARRFFNDPEYGWRIWSERPGDELRAATPWGQ